MPVLRARPRRGNGHALLHDHQMEAARADYLAGMSSKCIATKYRVTPRAVRGWVTRYGWYAWSLLVRQQAPVAVVDAATADAATADAAPAPVRDSFSDRLVNIDNPQKARAAYYAAKAMAVHAKRIRDASAKEVKKKSTGSAHIADKPVNFYAKGFDPVDCEAMRKMEMLDSEWLT